MRNYYPDEVALVFAGIPLEGFGEDTFVEVEYDTEGFTDVTGRDGDVSRSRSNDRRATVTVTIMQTSPTNAALQALHNTDMDTPGGAGVGAFAMRDRQGTLVVRADEAWIQTTAPVTLAREVQAREWVIRLARAETTGGGN